MLLENNMEKHGCDKVVRLLLQGNIFTFQKLKVCGVCKQYFFKEKYNFYIKRCSFHVIKSISNFVVFL